MLPIQYGLVSLIDTMISVETHKDKPFTFSSDYNFNILIDNVTCDDDIFSMIQKGEIDNEYCDDHPNPYHGKLFNDIVYWDDSLDHLCNSDEVGDNEMNGDYEYLHYDYDTRKPFGEHSWYSIIAMISSHPRVYPNRLIIFRPKYQVIISADTPYVYVYDPVPYIMLGTESKMKYLLNSDRPDISKIIT